MHVCARSGSDLQCCAYYRAPTTRVMADPLGAMGAGSTDPGPFFFCGLCVWCLMFDLRAGGRGRAGAGGRRQAGAGPGPHPVFS